MARGDDSSVMSLAELSQQVRDLRRLASPLFPQASRTVRRATWAAKKLGLVVVPYVYTVEVTASAAGSNTVNLQLDTPAAQGPVVVYDIAPPRNRPLCTFIVKQDNEYLTDGYCFGHDAFTLPREYDGRLSSSPMCLVGGAVLNIEITDASVFVEGNGIRVSCLGVRRVQRGNKQLGPVDDKTADRWLQMVAGGGLWWGTSLIGSSTKYATTSGDVVLEAIVIATKPADGVESVFNAQTINITVGDHQLTPQGINPAIGTRTSDEDDDDIITVLPGLQMPIPSSTRIQMDQVQYDLSAVTRIPVRVTFLGRRGGSAGYCW